MTVPAHRAFRVQRKAPGLVALALGLGLTQQLVSPALASENDCHTNTSVVERQLHIPNGLLLAISLVESGVDGVPQPNALSFGSRSLVAHSQEDAVRRLQTGGGGLRNDAYVGCMQLSVRYHRGAFHSLEKMMDTPGGCCCACAARAGIGHARWRAIRAARPANPMPISAGSGITWRNSTGTAPRRWSRAVAARCRHRKSPPRPVGPFIRHRSRRHRNNRRGFPETPPKRREALVNRSAG